MKILVFCNQQKVTQCHCLNRQIQTGSTTPAFNPNNPLISFSHSSLVDSVADELRPTCDQSLHITHTKLMSRTLNFALNVQNEATCRTQHMTTIPLCQELPPSFLSAYIRNQGDFTLSTTIRFSTSSQINFAKVVITKYVK